MISLFRFGGLTRFLCSAWAVQPQENITASCIHKRAISANISPSKTSQSAPFKKLKQHQIGRILRGSTFKKVEAVHLNANNPIEDSFSVGISENMNFAIFSVFDGHLGGECSQYLQNTLNHAISKDLHDCVNMEDDYQLVLNMEQLDQLNDTSSGGLIRLPWRSHAVQEVAQNTLQMCLKDAFLRVDSEFSKPALADVRNVMSGHKMTEEMLDRIMKAQSGACGLTAVVEKDRLFVACTGDCRAVLGFQAEYNWKAINLSTDQNFENAREVRRLQEAHPGEKVVINGRLLGGLAPFRAFGDVNYKWKQEHFEGIFPTYQNYKTPPYLTAEPVVTQRERTNSDKFLILATDGLWDCLSSEHAVSIVAKVMSESDPSCVTEDVSFRTGKNAATHLLYHALGGTDQTVSRMLELEADQRRWFRDDITVLVVYL